MTDRSDRNKQIVEAFWTTLYTRDFDAVAAMMAEHGEYTDVFTPDEDVAIGATQVAARLRLGLEPLSDIRHHPKLMVAEGDTVMFEHAEEWHWHTGESCLVRFVSVMEFDDEGKVVRWHDYPDLQLLLSSAPQWWIEHIMAGYDRV